MRAFFYVLIILRIVHLHMAYLDKEEWPYTRIITLKQGDVRGKVMKMKKNSFLKEVEVYLGIPYAAPPVASLRFMPPGAPPRWSETLNAFNVKPACPQMFPNLDHHVASPNRISPERNIFIRRLKQFLKNENEDCLYLNIYVPHGMFIETFLKLTLLVASITDRITHINIDDNFYKNVGNFFFFESNTSTIRFVG